MRNPDIHSGCIVVNDHATVKRGGTSSVRPFKFIRRERMKFRIAYSGGLG